MSRNSTENLPAQGSEFRVPEAEARLLDRIGHRYFRRRYLLLGSAAFLVVSAAGVAASTLWTSGGAVWPVLRAMSPPLLALLGLMVLADWALGGYRLYIFAHALAPKVGFRDSIRANLANIFMGGITPTQSGGGPAGIYMLWRAGLPLSSGVAFSVINFVSTLATLFGAVGFVLVLMPKGLPPAMVVTIRYSFVVFFLLLGSLLALLIAPGFFARAFFRVLERLGRVTGGRTGKQIGNWQERAEKTIAEWHLAVGLVSRKHPHLLVLSQVVTIGLYFNKCLIGYVVAVAMGIAAPFWSVLGAQAILIFVCYFAPTPGASFIAEVSNSFLMGWVSGAQNIALFTALVRVSTVWLAVVLGGFILVSQLRKDAGRFL